jgi:hypothetical protein
VFAAWCARTLWEQASPAPETRLAQLERGIELVEKCAEDRAYALRMKGELQDTTQDEEQRTTRAHERNEFDSTVNQIKEFIEITRATFGRARDLVEAEALELQLRVAQTIQSAMLAAVAKSGDAQADKLTTDAYIYAVSAAKQMRQHRQFASQALAELTRILDDVPSPRPG